MSNIKRDIMIVIALIIVCVTILVAFDRDPTQLISLIVVAIIPTVTTLLQGKKIEQVSDDAKSAKENAEQAVHNTNGRMGDLIKVIKANGGEVPSGYDDLE